MSNDGAADEASTRSSFSNNCFHSQLASPHRYCPLPHALARENRILMPTYASQSYRTSCKHPPQTVTGKNLHCLNNPGASGIKFSLIFTKPFGKMLHRVACDTHAYVNTRALPRPSPLTQ